MHANRKTKDFVRSVDQGDTHVKILPELLRSMKNLLIKSLLVSCVLLPVPVVVHAECTIKDFAITEFTPSAARESAGKLSLHGVLVNNCHTASAAQVEVQIKDSAGNVLQSKKAWPAGTSNVTPGQTVQFDLGRLFHYQADMASFTASIVSVRAW
jgi:hypothetical protein